MGNLSCWLCWRISYRGPWHIQHFGCQAYGTCFHSFQILLLRKSGVVGLHRTFSGSQFECGMYRNPVPSGPFVRCRHRVGSNIQVLRCYLVVHIRHFSNGWCNGFSLPTIFLALYCCAYNCLPQRFLNHSLYCNAGLSLFPMCFPDKYSNC